MVNFFGVSFEDNVVYLRDFKIMFRSWLSFLYLNSRR